VWAQQLHSTHYQPSEAIIRYVFHPRCGESVLVVGRNRRCDEVALTIRQPDGTLAQLPIWMTQDRAAAMTMTEVPRLSLACLRELRLELDTCQSLLRDDFRRAGDEHATPDIKPLLSRPLRAQEGSADPDSSGRADEAVASGERAPDPGTRCRHGDGGKR
jgi:hypothetical protein